VSFVVAIDGPAAAGKSTVARAVAAALGFLYVDTGALYRALGFKLRREGLSPDDPSSVERCLTTARLDLSGSPEHSHVWLDGEDVSAEIRTPEVSELASRLAAMPTVRRRLIEIQRGLRDRGPLVGEGRDLGTVVFPDAEVKVYLDADPATRARRRARELEQRGIGAADDQVLDELERRDARDRSRTDSPLRPATDAVRIDCSAMGIPEVVEAVLSVVRGHPAWPSAATPAGGQVSDPGRGSPDTAAD
jgi:cytidylate kinase